MFFRLFVSLWLDFCHGALGSTKNYVLFFHCVDACNDWRVVPYANPSACFAITSWEQLQHPHLFVSLPIMYFLFRDFLLCVPRGDVRKSWHLRSGNKRELCVLLYVFSVGIPFSDCVTHHRVYPPPPIGAQGVFVIGCSMMRYIMYISAATLRIKKIMQFTPHWL
jgi:hypothetical protein